MPAARLLLPLTALTVLALGACSSGDSSGPTASGPPTVTPTEDLTLTTGTDTGARGRKITAEITVAYDETTRCRSASVDGQVLDLMGLPGSIGNGTRLKITGYPDPTLSSPCQRGVPFVVEKYEPVG